MVQENEVIMLALGFGLYLFVLMYRDHLDAIPERRTLLLAFRLLLAAWLLTVLEGFFWAKLLNVLEHSCYAGSASIAALWCYKITRVHNGLDGMEKQ